MTQIGLIKANSPQWDILDGLVFNTATTNSPDPLSPTTNPTTTTQAALSNDLKNIFTKTSSITLNEIYNELDIFENFRELDADSKKIQVKFWETCNKQWNFYQSEPVTYKNILNLTLEAFIKRVATSFSSEFAEGLTPLHQAHWRRSLFYRDTFQVACAGAKDQAVSWVIGAKTASAHIVVVGQNDLTDATDRYRKVKPDFNPPAQEMERISQGLARMIAVDIYAEKEKLKGMRHGYFLAKEIYPLENPSFWRVLTILFAIYKLKQKSFKASQLREATNFREIIEVIAAHFQMPPIELAREILPRARDCGKWADYDPENAEHREAVVRLSLLLTPTIGTNIYKILHSNWNRWVKVSEENFHNEERISKLAFYLRHGIGAIIDEARSHRGWDYGMLADKVAEKPGIQVQYQHISAFCTHSTDLDFETLKAIIDVLNAHTTDERLTIDRDIALLTHYPELLTVFGFSPRRFSRNRKARKSLQLSHNSRKTLDPFGIPFLVRGRRFALGLEKRETESRFGFGRYCLDNIECDPSDSNKTPVGLDLFQSILKMGISLEVAVRAHEYSYWREDASIKKIRGRSIPEPLFVDARALRRIEKFAQQEAVTVGELLYAVRNTASGIENYKAKPEIFPLSTEDASVRAGFPSYKWKEWEQLKSRPTAAQVNQIIFNLRPSSWLEEMLKKSAA